MSVAALAQVQLDVPLRLVGPDGSRQVEQLAPPMQESAMVTVGYATAGTASWAVAELDGDTVQWDMAPAVTGYSDGMLVRFAAPVGLPATPWARLGGGAAAPLVRPDGLPFNGGSIAPGTVYEAVYRTPHFVVVAPAVRGCPQGSLPVGERLCIDQDEGPVQSFLTAVDHCTDRGGRLCTWAEYHTACALMEGELTGLFNNWEWSDDTANHTHTYGQVGRTTCMSQRSANASEANHGAVRCCYPLP